MKHKHYNEIVAWAEGKAVQFRSGSCGPWIDVESPNFHEINEYRIKPEPKRLKYRVALFMHKGSIWAEVFEEQSSAAAGRATFIRWLTDWTEVELEE